MIDFADWLPTIVAVFAVIPAAFAVNKAMPARRATEWEDLAEVRGAALEDAAKRIEVLEEKFETMEANMEALRILKAEEIAIEVVRLLRGNGDLHGYKE